MVNLYHYSILCIKQVPQGLTRLNNINDEQRWLNIIWCLLGFSFCFFFSDLLY